MSPLSDFKLGTIPPPHPPFCVSRRLCAFSTLGRIEGEQKGRPRPRQTANIM